jgi:hypothetical protein
MGNTVKLNDLKKVVEKKGGEIDADKMLVIDELSKGSVLEGPLNLIEKIGSELKKALKKFYENTQISLKLIIHTIEKLTLIEFV